MATSTVETSHVVFVTNISPAATEKKVSDFFSFCGKITQLYLKREEGQETSTAVIHFETDAAAKTALLLTSALIEDRPITVTSQTVPHADPGQATPQENITQREFNVPDDQRSKTSVVVSLLAAGYVLGQDALGKAQEFDEKHGLSQRAKVAVEQVKVKAQEIDKSYGITEKAAAFTAAVTEKATKINENYHISEKVTEAVHTAKTTVESVAAKAQENPHIAKGITTVTQVATNVHQTVNAALTDYKNQIDKAIEEQKSGVDEAIEKENASRHHVDQVATGVAHLSTEEKKDPPTQ